VGHPIYVALEHELEEGKRPYAWYMRVPDLPAFLQHIAPVLERRLTTSVMAGFSGETKLSFFRSHLALHWQQGKLKSVEPYTSDQFYNAHAYFPELTFLQLLFGYRSLAELDAAFADQFTSDADTAVLLNAIFPKQDSWVVPLG
jgi:hypothetical protein